MLQKAELISRVRSWSVDNLYATLLTGNNAHYFEDTFGDSHAEQYAAFRKIVGSLFKVPPNDVSLVGSAKVGFSPKG